MKYYKWITYIILWQGNKLLTHNLLSKKYMLLMIIVNHTVLYLLINTYLLSVKYVVNTYYLLYVICYMLWTYIIQIFPKKELNRIPTFIGLFCVLHHNHCVSQVHTPWFAIFGTIIINCYLFISNTLAYSVMWNMYTTYIFGHVEYSVSNLFHVCIVMKEHNNIQHTAASNKSFHSNVNVT